MQCCYCKHKSIHFLKQFYHPAALTRWYSALRLHIVCLMTTMEEITANLGLSRVKIFFCASLWLNRYVHYKCG